MYSRRARPTLRLLREDLTSGWESPYPQRALEEGRLDDLPPMSEQPHPIVQKAMDSFGEDPSKDNFVRPIASSTRLRILEIKQSQWRGGVWQDPETDICWLVVAGLAKGNHRDADDFYERVRRENEFGDPSQWLPDSEDKRLLKRETAARLRTEWELNIQRDVLNALKIVHTGGAHRLNIDHPIPGKGPFSSIEISVDPERGDETNDDSSGSHVLDTDDIIVEFTPEKQYASTELFWSLITRVLISIEPPHQNWDRFGNTFSNMGEPGAWTQRIEDLSELVDANLLALSESGIHSHYAHRKHLAGKTIAGEAVRSLCGTYFVPTQDHEALPKCPICQERFSLLPER